MAFRFATLADRQGILDQITPAVLTAFRNAGYLRFFSEDAQGNTIETRVPIPGSVEKPNLARLQQWIQDNEIRVVVSTAANGNINGGGVGQHLPDGRWQIIFVIGATNTIVRGMVKFVTDQFPNATFMYRAIIGSTFDNFLLSRIPGGTETIAGFREYSALGSAWSAIL